MTSLNEPSLFLPQARETGVIHKEVDGELLIYDLTRDKAHCLNESAAAIWKLCDGRTSTEEIAASLTKDVGTVVDERLIWLALADLRRAHLLEEPERAPSKITQKQSRSKIRHKSQLKQQLNSQWPQTILPISRREAVKLIGLGAAIALPVVISITSPTPAQAGSLLPLGAACSTSAECAGGLCMNDVCV